MLAQLALQADITPAPEWQWHFIPAIDIDGIALNQGWFSGSPDVERYLASFFRPPFRLQPEYSFPIDLPDYQFAEGTPENDCWRRALEIVRPRLQCSLHGADTGGAFFILSEDLPGLADELVTLPASFGISLNEIGEPFADMSAYRPGVFSFPSIPDIVARSVEAGLTPGTSWQAGDSSAGFAGARFGTFSMTCEVPLWHDAREGINALSDRTITEVVDDRIGQLREDVELVSDWLPSLRSRVDSSEALCITESLEDSIPASIGMITALEQARRHGANDRPLAVRELAWFEAGTYAMRIPALVLRLAVITQDTRAETVSGALLETRLAEYRRSAHLAPVPLAQAADLQLAAVLTTARFLGETIS